MEIFTDTEKRILEATDKNYKWIARDKDGRLYLYTYEIEPHRNEVCESFDVKFGGYHLFDKCVSDVLFKNVTWENSPIQYRDSELLTPKEREYLKFVFKPFANDILYVQKILADDNTEYIVASIYNDDSIDFPYFNKGTMYKEMKSGKKYTLEELGIIYNE